MKTLYLDCGMGAAGDMLTAALLELVPDKQAAIDELNALGIPDVEYVAETSVKCGITGTHMSVKVGGEEETTEDVHDHDHHHEHEHEHHHHHHDDEDHDHEHHHDDEDHDHEHHHHHHDDEDHDHEHHHDHVHGEHTHTYTDEEGHVHTHTHSHNNLHGIEHIIKDHLNLPEKVQEDVLAVYGLIAEAESHAHNQPIDQIHFHEVGTMDAVADITAVCYLMNKIAPDQVVVSPVHVGAGKVRCAHGILPVPAPATAYILQGVPMYGGRIQGELCTPTGAALLKHFATRFGDMPTMVTESIGYGMGKKDFEAANCVRAILGNTEEAPNVIVELTCNVDDMTGEALGYAMEKLFEAGAVEVYTVNVGMKKSRPGIMLCVMAPEKKKDDVIAAVFKHTTTIGIRESYSKRYTLKRRFETIQTPYGDVTRKVSFGYGVERSKLEFEDLAKISRETGKSLSELREEIERM